MFDFMNPVEANPAALGARSAHLKCLHERGVSARIMKPA
jgi:hypothetical protein